MIPTPGSYGRGFVIQARETFVEIRDAPGLMRAMEMSQERSLEAAVREFTESISSIRTQCRCDICHEETFEVQKNSRHNGPFCMVLLVYMLCNFIRLSSQIVFHKDTSVRPTLAGIERLYFSRNLRISGDDYFDGPRILMRRWFSGEGNLEDIQKLFTGRGVSDVQSAGLRNISAVAIDGLCIYSNTLCEVSANLERACFLYVVPGRIQWNDYLYAEVRDSKGFWRDVQDDSKWPSTRASVITTYDNLSDSSTHDLEAALVIEEASPHDHSITASWRVSSSKGFFALVRNTSITS